MNCVQFVKLTFIHARIYFVHAVNTYAYGRRGCRVVTAVCLSVLPHDISKTNASRMTKLDTQLFHDEFWKPFILKPNGQRSRSRVTKTVQAWVFALL